MEPSPNQLDPAFWQEFMDNQLEAYPDETPQGRWDPSVINPFFGGKITLTRAQQIADEVVAKYGVDSPVKVQFDFAPAMPLNYWFAHDMPPFGAYNPTMNEIRLTTPHLRVLLHELAHVLQVQRNHTLGHGPVHAQAWRELEAMYGLRPEDINHA